MTTKTFGRINPNIPLVLVTGAGGMTGSHLLDIFSENELFRTDLHESPGIHHLDVCASESVMQTVAHVRPSLVIHLAAETNVDRCQLEPDHAFRSNLFGTLNVALACQRYEAELVYVSTASVFPGTKTEPYTEFDAPGPVNVYAKSKLEGEKIVQATCPRHYIVRAGWMFGGRGRDIKFVGKIAQQCLEGGSTAEVRAVNDKIGSPTYARDLLNNVKILSKTGFYGVYNVVNTGTATRYDVAVEIARVLQSEAKITPVSSDCFVLPAPRPNSEAARSYKLDLLGLNHMQNWRSALRDYLACWTTPRVVSAENGEDKWASPQDGYGKNKHVESAL